MFSKATNHMPLGSPKVDHESKEHSPTITSHFNSDPVVLPKKGDWTGKALLENVVNNLYTLQIQYLLIEVIPHVMVENT